LWGRQEKGKIQVDKATNHKEKRKKEDARVSIVF